MKDHENMAIEMHQVLDASLDCVLENECWSARQSLSGKTGSNFV